MSFPGQVGQLAFSRKIRAPEIGVAAFERKGEIPQIPVEIPPDFNIEPGQDLGQFEFPPFPAARTVVDPPAAEQGKRGEVVPQGQLHARCEVA